jgi:hypothetical protein
MLTAALGVVAVGLLVYSVGVEESREAAARAGGGLKRGATSGVAVGAGGAALGLQFGDQIVSAILADPGFALAAVAGFFGALGTGGFLGDLTAVQFGLIGITAFIAVYAVFGGDD